MNNVTLRQLDSYVKWLHNNMTIVSKIVILVLHLLLKEIPFCYFFFFKREGGKRGRDGKKEWGWKGGRGRRNKRGRERGHAWPLTEYVLSCSTASMEPIDLLMLLPSSNQIKLNKLGFFLTG